MDKREYLIKEEGSLKKYRTEIPNTIIKGSIAEKLSVYDKFLYVFLKSVAGEAGLCYQSTKTLSKNTGMSMGQISKSKKQLLRYNLIKIKKGQYHKGLSDSITITDIWLNNMMEFHTPSSDEETPSPDEKTSSCGEITPSCDEKTPSPHEPKNNPYKEEPYKEKRARKDLEKIYKAYPRNLKKEESLKAIEIALNDISTIEKIENPEQWLLKKVKLFAKAKEKVNRKYIPYPDNWFSKKRYNDDPTEWNHEEDNAQGHYQPNMPAKNLTEMEAFRENQETILRARDLENNPPPDPTMVQYGIGLMNSKPNYAEENK